MSGSQRHALALAALCCLWLLGPLPGCTDRATIGVLCLGQCDSPARDASTEAAFDAGRTDACAGQPCTPGVAEVCDTADHPLTRKPLDLLVVLDEGSSVYGWWPALREGFVQFLNQAESKGIGVGLHKFGEVCDAAEYVAPVVPIAALPENAAALEAALSLTAGGGSSTLPAITGALGDARSWATAHAAARVAVVLVTDAGPEMCDPADYDKMANAMLVAERQSVPSIDTYVVGVGEVIALGPLARAGGSELRKLEVLPDSSEALSAFASIRDSARPCEFAWPSGLTLDVASRVVVTSSAGQERPYVLRRGSDSCADDGFYTVDETSEYPLVACPRTCADLAATSSLTLSGTCSAR